MNRNTFETTLAYGLKAIREIKHLKQKSLANDICIDQSIYSRMENAEIGFTIHQIHRICQHLDFNILTLITVSFIIAEFYSVRNIKPCKTKTKAIFNYITSNSELRLIEKQFNTTIQNYNEVNLQNLHKEFTIM